MQRQRMYTDILCQCTAWTSACPVIGVAEACTFAFGGLKLWLAFTSKHSCKWEAASRLYRHWSPITFTFHAGIRWLELRWAGTGGELSSVSLSVLKHKAWDDRPWDSVSAISRHWLGSIAKWKRQEMFMYEGKPPVCTYSGFSLRPLLCSWFH